MERATWRLIMLFFLFTVLFIPNPVASFSGSGSGVGSGSEVGSGSGVDSEENATSATLTLLHFIFINSNNARFRSSGSAAAVDIALAMIDRHKILHPYALRYKTSLDSQCNRTTALDVFYNAVEERKNFTQYLGVIGSGCSIASIPVAEVSHYYNIPMISWTSSAAVLKDRLRFRNYFRTVPSEESHSPGLAGLLRHLKWRQVAILTQLESLFISVERTVVSLLPEVDIVARHFQTNDNPMLVPDLFVKDKNMRIFVLNMYINHAKTILCQAYHLGMYYPRYLWITPGWYGYTWWEAELPLNCTKQHMEQVLDYSLSAVQYPIVNESEISDLELSTDTFRLVYIQRVLRLGLLPDLTSPLAFDAVWTLAFALKRTMEKVERHEEGGCAGLEGDIVPLEKFTYHNKKMGCILKESIAQTKFKGVTGVVKFAINGNRIGNTVRISQYQSKSRLLGSMTTPLIAYATIGGKTEFDTDDELDIANITVQYQLNESVIWPEGVSPDGIANNLTMVIELPLTVIYYLVSTAGIVFAVVCLFFNIIFRNKKVVRLTSPNLNYLVIAGAILLYVSIFFWVTPAGNKGIATTLCNLRIWFFSLGNTLCLAVVLSKMWRVYYIFTNPKPKRKPKPPQDWHLLIIVSVLVAVDFVILLVPTANPSSRLQGQLIESKEHTNTEDSLGVRQEYSFYGCYNKTQYIWLIISYTYKFVLQLVAIYFAFMTRKVKVKALNDSKQIAAIIYITSLLLVISVFGFWIGLLYLNTSAAVFGVAQLLTATVFLGLVFIPKMIQLKLDPEGDNIFSQTQFPSITNTGLGSVDTQKINELSKQVKELKEELEKCRGGGNGKELAYTLEVSTFQGPGRNGTVTSEDSLDSKPSKTSNTDTTHTDSTAL